MTPSPRGLGGRTDLVAGIILCLAGIYGRSCRVSAAPGGDSDGAAGGEGPGLRRLVVLAAALNIDNLAIGFALGAYHVNVVVAALVIGVVSVGLALLGLELGSRVGARLGERGERALPVAPSSSSSASRWLRDCCERTAPGVPRSTSRSTEAQRQPTRRRT